MTWIIIMKNCDKLQPLNRYNDNVSLINNSQTIVNTYWLNASTLNNIQKN
jgi:hypothetical protein